MQVFAKNGTLASTARGDRSVLRFRGERRSSSAHSIFTAAAFAGAVLVLPIASVSPTAAQGVPVVDTQNIAQEIRQFQQMLEDFGIQTDQLDRLVEQIDLLQDQIDQLEETYAALSGASDIVQMAMDRDLNGLLDAEFGDMVELAGDIAKGDYSGLIGSAAPRLKTQMETVLNDAGFDEDTIREMATSGEVTARNTATRATTGAVMSAAAENSHADAGKSLERVDELVSMIADQETLKQSVDHNTRVTAELAIALTRMWELEAIQTVGAGQSGVVDAATIAEEQRFMDFTLPDLD
ncbi:type IV secretion system protein [Fulvimarina sp. 2208YS6-2-32]|uniref:Type IV secretion system protein n=1 Tax=Fulvimarina uroteuthidis TaxID=3098149 RepID=A0ABU5I6C9_9HYPH|nr:type IV secretion system protein [Fulvimarina sp. 2208YS6-2-32]